MNKLRDHNPGPVEPFSDRLATLFGELDLAARWERPSILFAVYCSDYTRAEAQTELEKQLAAANQKICRLDGAGSAEAGLVQRIKAANGDCRSVVFVEGIGSATEDCGRAILENLNFQRDAFVEDNLRVVFWLNEDQICDLANCAPDLWSFRHRVVEFPDVPEPEKIMARTLDAAWQNFDEAPAVPDALFGGVSLPATLLNRLPQGEESAGVYINLLLTLGIMHWRKHDLEKAEEFIRAATEIAQVTADEKLLAESLNASALIRISQKKYEEAVRIYERSLQAAPDQTFPWGHLGNLYDKLGRDHEAIGAFRKALQTEPADAFNWHGMAEIYGRLQLSKPALEHYQKAVELSPNLVAAWLGMAKVYANSGEAAKANTALVRCLDIDGQNCQAWLELAQLHAASRKTPEALSAYRKVIELDPKNLSALRALGELYLGAKMNEDAITAFRGAIAIEPDSGVDYRNLGMAHFQNGDFNEAVLLFRKSLNLATLPALKAETYNRLGDAYRGLQEYDKAVQAYQAADQLTRSLPPGVPTQERIEPEPAAATLAISQGESVGEDLPFAAANPLPESAPDLWSFEKAALGMESEHWLGQGAFSIESPVAEAIVSQAPVASGMPETAPIETASVLWPEQQPTESHSPQPAAPDGDFEGELFDPRVPPPSSSDPGPASEEAAYWNNLGNQLLNQGAFSEAIAAYTYAIELSPEISWPYIRNLTTAHYRKGKSRGERPAQPEADGGQPGAARRADQEEVSAAAPAPQPDAHALEAAPSPADNTTHEPNRNQSVQRLIQQGNEQMRTGEYAEAVQTFIKAVEKQPDFGWAYCNLGIAYSHIGKNTYAVLALKKGIDYLDGDKEKAVGWRHLSEVYAKVGDPVNANFAMETALSLEREKTSILQRARVMLLGNTPL